MESAPAGPAAGARRGIGMKLAKVVFTALAMSGAVAWAAEIQNGEALVKAMHDR